MSVVLEIEKAIGELPPAMPGYGYVYWNAEKKWAWIVLGDSDDGDKFDAWMKRIKKIKGVLKVDGESETGPPGRDDEGSGWEHIKRKKSFESVVEVFDPKLVDIAFLMGSGRLNIEDEFKIMAVVGAADFAEFNRKMRSVTPKQIARMWKIAKATKSGQRLALGEYHPFEAMVERSYTHAAVSNRLDQRRANPVRVQQGAVASRDFKKAGGQRAGQRLRSVKRSRVP